MNRQPKLMSLLRMRDILEPYADEIRKCIYIDEHLVIIHGSANVLRIIIQQQPPFTFDDRRMGIVIRGEARVNLNLVEKCFTAGMLVYIGPGSVISPLSISSDFEIYGFGIPADFPLPCQLPQAFNGQVRDFQIPVSKSDISTAHQILDTLWHLVHQESYDLQTIGCLIAAQMHHYAAQFCQYTNLQQNILSREQTIFDRFINLVNLHSQHEHQIAFYARKMCLTERYLSTIVRQASGITAKEWIDRAIVTRIKIELRHTNDTVAQISEKMNFPNPSFFCKYFKRLTSMTPAGYRLS